MGARREGGDWEPGGKEGIVMVYYVTTFRPDDRWRYYLGRCKTLEGGEGDDDDDGGKEGFFF